MYKITLRYNDQTACAAVAVAGHLLAGELNFTAERLSRKSDGLENLGAEVEIKVEGAVRETYNFTTLNDGEIFGRFVSRVEELSRGRE